MLRLGKQAKAGVIVLLLKLIDRKTVLATRPRVEAVDASQWISQNELILKLMRKAGAFIIVGIAE